MISGDHGEDYYEVIAADLDRFADVPERGVVGGRHAGRPVSVAGVG
ncbi:hypothetical protein GCM10010185_11690 [Saccharothrix coeruleofusca]|uniref:Uncharacterized protein n=1 Tax=Saccharothrix coeruleofusca TaxID=33919 RepID=A0A918AJT5_9PSEU|nr:hypothetical protein GCM10010185_11690 [Saccharothrix coeruleofusca]